MSARCLVLGGTGYVGSAICRELREEDCQVAWTTDPGRLCDTSEGIICDLRQMSSVRDAVEQAAAQLGGLDAIVVAAGLSGDAFYFQQISSADHDRLGPVTQEQFDELMEANVRGTFAACQAAAPYLKQSASGNIVILAAIDGLKPVPAPVHFAASQSALRGMVESLAKELGHYQICVNLLALGILQGGWADQTGDALRDAYLTHCCLKRFGTAEEVSQMVAWLVVENTYLSGQTVVLDGGL